MIMGSQGHIVMILYEEKRTGEKIEELKRVDSQICLRNTCKFRRQELLSSSVQLEPTHDEVSEVLPVPGTDTDMEPPSLEAEAPFIDTDDICLRDRRLCCAVGSLRCFSGIAVLEDGIDPEEKLSVLRRGRRIFRVGVASGFVEAAGGPDPRLGLEETGGALFLGVGKSPVSDV